MDVKIRSARFPRVDSKSDLLTCNKCLRIRTKLFNYIYIYCGLNNKIIVYVFRKAIQVLQPAVCVLHSSDDWYLTITGYLPDRLESGRDD
jgi:hypothetical protein